MTEQESLALVRLIQQGDRPALAQLLAGSVGLVRTVLKRVRVPPCVEYDDLRQEGLLAVWRAAERFDVSRGRWAAYAARAVYRSLVTWMRPLARLRALRPLPFQLAAPTPTDPTEAQARLDGLEACRPLLAELIAGLDDVAAEVVQGRLAGEEFDSIRQRLDLPPGRKVYVLYAVSMDKLQRRAARLAPPVEPGVGEHVRLTANQAADLLGVQRSWVYKLVRLGTLPCERTPGRRTSLKFRRADVETYRRRHPNYRSAQ